MAMKQCKECGTEISSSAKVCPKCGKKQKMSKGLIAIIVIILLIIIVAVSGGDSDNTVETNSPATDSTPEVIEYTAINIDTMEDDLENNAAAAKDTYNGKYFEITGKLGTIDSDLKYISLRSLTDEWDLTGIHCTIKNDEQKEFIKTLSKDDTIVVKGKITEVGEVMGFYLDITEITK